VASAITIGTSNLTERALKIIGNGSLIPNGRACTGGILIRCYDDSLFYISVKTRVVCVMMCWDPWIRLKVDPFTEDGGESPEVGEVI
jgi:hypothetical protein